jgi:hypothetical protein
MKKFLALGALLAAAVLAANVALAIDDNSFGLFYDRAATIDEIDITANTQQFLYLVLINPVSDFGNVQLVGGFECAIVPASGDILMGVEFPLDAFNITGSAEDLVVGYAQGLQVESSGTTLATLSVLTMGNNPEGYYLQPAPSGQSSNSLAYLDLGGPEPIIVAAEPISGSFDRPVFTFGDYSVEEDKMWGDVKSIYR